MITYLLIGLIFQWLMHYGTIYIAPEYSFTHGERVVLILVWPIGLIGFIYSFIKTFFGNNE
jgi:hypothetical protein